MTEKEWTPSDIATLKTLWIQGETARNIGAQLGRTKNSIIGKVGRLKLHRTKEQQDHIDTLRRKGELLPPPEGMVPAEQAIQEWLEKSYPTEATHYAEMSLIAAGALIDSIDPKEIAAAAGRGVQLARRVHEKMTASGIWGPDAGDIKRYDGQEGWMQLLLEAMMVRGEIHYQDGLWHTAEQ